MGNLFWACNAGNLLLGISMLAGSKELVRATAIWTFPGLIVWFIYVFVPYVSIILAHQSVPAGMFTTTLAHVGGFAMGVVALRRVRVDRLAWLFGFGWYLRLQVVSRLLTNPDLNVNVAHRVQPGFESAFNSFWKFWLVMTLAVVACLWLLGAVLRLVWPERE